MAVHTEFNSLFKAHSQLPYRMIRRFLAIALCGIAPLTVAYSAPDWRIDLLKSKGIATTPKSLEKVVSKSGFDRARAEALFQQLGNPSYKERENAQQALLLLGPPALKFLKSRQPVKDPEVRARSTQI